MPGIARAIHSPSRRGRVHFPARASAFAGAQSSAILAKANSPKRFFPWLGAEDGGGGTLRRGRIRAMDFNGRLPEAGGSDNPGAADQHRTGLEWSGQGGQMISRRGFARLLGRAGAGALSAGAFAPFAMAQRAPRVVIVGGGAGGATVAHY